MEPVKLHFLDYIEQHKELLVPPVCNKMIHNDGKLRVMIVGGPNQRKDYHLNLGEEVFYQIKGDMCLKINEKGKPKDVPIKEGEIFVLPSGIPHSPQRFESTVGLVIERARPEDELDGLRYYVDDTNQEVLWQRFFHVTDLGKQLKPLIQEYFASEEFKTRVPSKSMPPTVWEPNTELAVETPYPLESRYSEVEKGGSVVLFARKDEFVVTLIGGGGEAGSHGLTLPIQNECWLWVIHGKGKVNEGTELGESNTYITFNSLHSLELEVGSRAMLVYTTHKC